MPSPLEVHRAQIQAILEAWGTPPDRAEKAGEILAWADLHGIESHGISMLDEYDDRRRRGRTNMAGEPRLVSETPVSALVDGAGGFGHPTSWFAMTIAIRKAKEVGMAAVAVRNSSHFGAVGYYTAMAAEAGLIGMGATTAAGVRVAPTGGARARLGTDPWSFSAPGDPDRPFLLDMATTTVAYGKVRNKINEAQPLPLGWGLDGQGRPTEDPKAIAPVGDGFLTPLGGSRENSSYKGYGLSMMVNILASCLSGATLITDPMHTRQPKGMDIGHFFLALDPGLFRDPAEFRADVASLCDTMRATPPAEAGRPVQVAGDPERAAAERRSREGIPVAPGLLAKIRDIADECGAPWLLHDDPRRGYPANR